MTITQAESHMVSVLAGQGQTTQLCRTVRELAEREGLTPGDVLIACKDDFQQTAAHIASKAGQIRSIEALATLFEDEGKRVHFFNMANRFSGDRPVHTAMRHGFLPVVRALVTHGADPLVKNRFGDSITDYLGDFEEGEVQEIIDRWRKSQGAGS